MSSGGNQHRLAGSDLGLRRDEMRRLQGGSLRERVFPGVVVSAGAFGGYNVAIMQPNGEASTKQWLNVLPVLPGATFSVDEVVMLIFREGSETPRIQAGGGGGGGGPLVDGGIILGEIRFFSE